MTDLIVALRDLVGLSVDDLRDWPPAAFDALRRRLWLFFWNSLAVLAGVIVFSFVTHTQAFIPYVGIGYIVLVGFLAKSQQALHGAGLLLGVDAAIDILKGSVPVNMEHLERLLTLGTDMKRLKAFATLQLVGRFLFNVLLLELLILATVWLVPIWVYPGLLGAVAFLGTIFALLSTPWGRTSPFAGFRAIVFLVIVGTCAYAYWNYAYEQADKLVNVADSFNFHGHVMVVVIAILALAFLVLNFIPSAKTTIAAPAPRQQEAPRNENHG
jgi:hypothetical protein